MKIHSQFLLLISACLCLCSQMSAMPDFHYTEKHHYDGLDYYIRDNKAYVAGSNLQQVVVPEHLSFYYLVEKGSYFLPAGPSYDTVYVEADVVAIYPEAFYEKNITSIKILPAVEVGEKAFKNCTALTDVVFTGGATIINEYAFSGCSSLRNVNFGNHNTLTEIKYFAFENCTSLTSIQLPETIERLNGFTGCAGLTRLNLPNKLKTIGLYAFKDCTGLTQISCPENLESIGQEAFKNCTQLDKITFNRKLESIGQKAFENCTGLTSLSIDGLLRTIGSYAFSNCNLLKTVELFNEDTLTIDNNAFSQCKGLEKVFCRDLGKWCLIFFSTANANPLFYTHHLRYPPSPSHAEGQLVQRVTVPDGIKKISSYAFRHLDDMTHVELPRSVEKIGNYAFNSWVADVKVVRVGFKEPFIIADSTFNKRNYRDAQLIVPNVQGCKEAFSTTKAWLNFAHIIPTGHYDFTFEKIIDFEDPLVKQLCVAKWDMNNDGELSYGEARSVANIGRVFYKTDITTFNELQYFSGLTAIPEWAFSHCHQLRSIVLPETVLEICDNAFTYASALEAIHIPALVETIGEAVFAGATSIQQLTLDPDNTHFVLQDEVLYQGIPAETLIYCPPYKLGTIMLPTTVSAVTGNAFYLCEKVTSVMLNQGLESLGDGVFQGCSGLTTLTIPSSVTSIGQGCFYCPNVKAVYVAEDNEVYQSTDGVLYRKDGSELIYYPPAKEGVSYSVLDGTELVSSYSCYENHLEQVTLPASTKELGTYALGASAQLQVVQCLALDPPILNANAFKDLNTGAMLYVPAEAIEAYRQSPWALLFPNILPVGITPIVAKSSVQGAQYYLLDGHHSPVPHKGINIVRRSDGATQKILIK